MLSLRHLNRVRNIDPLNYSLIAEAGCILADVQRAADDADRLFPLSLGSEGTCQIGGNLSTNAGGTSVLRYGMMRDLVLGLEVVLADGRVPSRRSEPCARTTPVTTSSRCLLGAEGTLGVITAAALKLFSKRCAAPRPPSSRRSQACRPPSSLLALAARGQWRPCQLLRVDPPNRYRSDDAAHPGYQGPTQTETL